MAIIDYHQNPYMVEITDEGFKVWKDSNRDYQFASSPDDLWVILDEISSVCSIKLLGVHGISDISNYRKSIETTRLIFKLYYEFQNNDSSITNNSLETSIFFSLWRN